MRLKRPESGTSIAIARNTPLSMTEVSAPVVNGTAVVTAQRGS